MTIKNFDITLKNIDGTNLLDESEKPILMKTVLVNACMTPFPNENLVDGDEKAKRFVLGMRLNTGGDIEVLPEEIVLLKKLVGYGWPPLIVGQIYEFMNK